MAFVLSIHLKRALAFREDGMRIEDEVQGDSETSRQNNTPCYGRILFRCVMQEQCKLVKNEIRYIKVAQGRVWSFHNSNHVNMYNAHVNIHTHPLTFP